jgi:hypothetical protein
MDSGDAIADGEVLNLTTQLGDRVLLDLKCEANAIDASSRRHVNHFTLVRVMPAARSVKIADGVDSKQRWSEARLGFERSAWDSLRYVVQSRMAKQPHTTTNDVTNRGEFVFFTV